MPLIWRLILKILVTGATGFIGRNLVKRLLEEKHEVMCTVRITSNTDFMKGTEASLVLCDLMDAGRVEKVFSMISPEAVYHCAAQVEGNNEEDLTKINAGTTRNVCSAALEHEVSRLIYLSSVAVVSGNETMPLTEEMPYNATNPYGRSKVKAEKIALEFRDKGLQIAIIRPCMVYGEEEPHALDKVFRQVKKKLIPIFETPGVDSSLHLAYVGNVVDLLYTALSKDEALRGTYMVADKEVITIRRFIEIMYKDIGKGSPSVIPASLMRILMLIPPVKRKINRYLKDRVYDISRAEDLLEYDPNISTEKGLLKTIEYWTMKQKERAGGRKNRRVRKVSFDP